MYIIENTTFNNKNVLEKLNVKCSNKEYLESFRITNFENHTVLYIRYVRNSAGWPYLLILLGKVKSKGITNITYDVYVATNSSISSRTDIPNTQKNAYIPMILYLDNKNYIAIENYADEHGNAFLIRGYVNGVQKYYNDGVTKFIQIPLNKFIHYTIEINWEKWITNIYVDGDILYSNINISDTFPKTLFYNKIGYYGIFILAGFGDYFIESVSLKQYITIQIL